MHIGKLSNKLHEVKYGEQKGLCNACMKPLIDWEERIIEPENPPVDDKRKKDMAANAVSRTVFGQEELDLQIK